MFNPSPENGFWRNPDLENCSSIEVPGEWIMQGFHVDKGVKAGYYRTFNISPGWKGKRIKLRCKGIYSESVIYINGKEAGEVIKAIDPSRPKIFSQWGPEADNGELEITNHHYPGPEGPNMYKNSKHPIVFDEFCHLNSYNRFELAADPGIRNMWAVLLDRMWNDMYYSQGVLGGALWAGIDDTFFLPGRGAVGYGTWGPIDGWRRHKPEYWNVKKAFSPVRIRQKGNISNEGAILFEIENRHNFTNLSECKFVWKSGENTVTINIDLDARKEGTFTITLPQSARTNKSLYLSITSPLRYVIDEYNFTVLPEFNINKHTGKKQLTIKELSDRINIHIHDIRIEWNKLNGLINIYNKENINFFYCDNFTICCDNYYIPIFFRNTDWNIGNNLL